MSTGGGPGASSDREGVPRRPLAFVPAADATAARSALRLAGCRAPQCAQPAAGAGPRVVPAQSAGQPRSVGQRCSVEAGAGAGTHLRRFPGARLQGHALPAPAESHCDGASPRCQRRPARQPRGTHASGHSLYHGFCEATHLGARRFPRPVPAVGPAVALADRRRQLRCDKPLAGAPVVATTRDTAHASRRPISRGYRGSLGAKGTGSGRCTRLGTGLGA